MRRIEERAVPPEIVIAKQMEMTPRREMTLEDHVGVDPFKKQPDLKQEISTRSKYYLDRRGTTEQDLYMTSRPSIQASVAVNPFKTGDNYLTIERKLKELDPSYEPRNNHLRLPQETTRYLKQSENDAKLTIRAKYTESVIVNEDIQGSFNPFGNSVVESRKVSFKFYFSTLYSTDKWRER